MKKDLTYYLMHPEEAVDIAESDLRSWLQTYPYSPAVHLLKARKDLHTQSKETEVSLSLASKYHQDLTFLKYQLLKDSEAESDMIQRIESWSPSIPEVEERKSSSSVLDLTKPTHFEPHFTEEKESSSVGIESKTKPAMPVNENIEKDAAQGEEREEGKPLNDTINKTSASSSEKKGEKAEKRQKAEKVNRVLQNEMEKLSDFTQWLINLENEGPATEKTVSEAEVSPVKKKKKKNKKKKQKSRLEKLIDQSIAEREEAISETYADVLAKQGYTDKAIEVYRQLQLNFPKKSAYFAAKIEKLENK